MKKSYLLILALVAFLFSACSDDATDDKGGINPEGNSWLALRINSSVRTRALNTTDEETGKPAESDIKAVRVVLFDGFDDASKVTNVADLVLSSSAVGTDLLTESKAFQVSSSARSILIIVNPSGKLPNIVPASSTFADVNKAIAATVADVAGTSGFMMTNASGLLEPNTYTNSSGTVTVTPGNIQDNTENSESAAEGNRLSFTVDRVVAKVRLYDQTTPSTPPGDPSNDSDIVMVFADMEWGLNVTNKMFFPMSKRTRTFLNTTTWSDAHGLGSYRIDPNYDGPVMSGTDGNPTYTPEYLANYNFEDADATTYVIDWKDPTTASSGPITDPENGTDVKNDVEYCLENTQEEEFNRHAYTTHAVIRAKVYPSHVKNADGTTYAATNSTGDWIKISNGYYTYATLLDWIYAEMLVYYTNGSTHALTNLFNSYLEYLEDEGVTTAVTIPAYDPSGSGDAATLATAVRTEFASRQIAVEGHGADSFGSVSYYEDGYNYYKVMIKHDNDNPSTVINKLGEFGVVRNSVYDIKISAIYQPGYPIIPKPEPETPDEESELYLAVDIEINPWTWYSQVEEL